jgi:hypothetical protein
MLPYDHYSSAKAARSVLSMPNFSVLGISGSERVQVCRLLASNIVVRVSYGIPL